MSKILSSSSSSPTIHKIFADSCRHLLSLNPELRLPSSYANTASSLRSSTFENKNATKQATSKASNVASSPAIALSESRDKERAKAAMAEANNYFNDKVEAIEINGWVKSIRHHKKYSFMAINDGSSFNDIQVVISKEMLEKHNVNMIGTGTSVKVNGKLSLHPKISKVFEGTNKDIVVEPSEYFEVQATKFNIIGECDQNEYPLQKKYHTAEFLREKMHLRPRTRIISSAMRIRSSVSLSIHNFFANEGFSYLHTPLITGLDCEGGGEQFHVSVDESRLKHLENSQSKSFFGDSCPDPRLTVSGQLEGEMYACGGLSRVYTFGPTFRAENSNTTRHLAEFWMVEPEAAFMNLKDMQSLSERCVKYVINDMMNKHPEELHFFEKRLQEPQAGSLSSTTSKSSRATTSIMKDLEKTMNSSFITMTFKEAEDILIKKEIRKMKYSENGNVSDLGGLSTEEERYLTEVYCNRVPIFVTGFPKSCKPFYMRTNDRSKDDEYDTVGAMDLLVPRIGELIGGSEREERYDLLKKRMENDGLLKTKSLDWYLELRQFGTVPHAGFGMGLERLILFITGIENIRDVIAVPRYPGFCRF